MSFAGLLAIALQLSLQMQVLSANSCLHSLMQPWMINSLFMASRTSNYIKGVFSLSRFYDVIAFVRISKIMLIFFITGNSKTCKCQFLPIPTQWWISHIKTSHFICIVNRLFANSLYQGHLLQKNTFRLFMKTMYNEWVFV